MILQVALGSTILETILIILIHVYMHISYIELKFTSVNGFRYYLSGTDMTMQNYDGRTALHVAAAQGIEGERI